MTPTTPPLSPCLIGRFIDLVGPRNAMTDPREIAPYLCEWRNKYIGVSPLVLKPGSTKEVSDILALAHETVTSIVPQGGNSGLVGGQIPSRRGDEIILSLSRLNTIREIDVRGDVMTVEAGVILAEVQQQADRAGRLFPLSLASEGSAQIGGNLATNAGGVAVLSYGTMRDLVLGLEVVLASGEICNGLKALRKDNTGYDLKNLFIGSEGTLGVITAAVLKLFPKPAEKASAFVGLESLDDVARFFALVRSSSGRALTAFELLPRIGIDFVLKHLPASRDPLGSASPWYVLMELSGSQAMGEMAALAETILEKGLESRIISDAALAASLAHSKDFWRIREAMSEVQKKEGGSIKHDVSVPIAQIPDFIEAADKIVEKIIPGSRPIPFGHFGDGNIHYNVSQPVAMERTLFLAEWDRLSKAVYGLAVALGGSISAEHGIGRMKRKLLADLKDPVELRLMKEIKQTLDPKGILNPGTLFQ